MMCGQYIRWRGAVRRKACSESLAHIEQEVTVHTVAFFVFYDLHRDDRNTKRSEAVQGEEIRPRDIPLIHINVYSILRDHHINVQVVT